MSLIYVDENGVESKIAATVESGELIPSVTHYQSGSFTSPKMDSSTTRSVTNTIVFSDPMPDNSTDYVIDIQPTGGAYEYTNWCVTNKNANGFTVMTHFLGSDISVHENYSFVNYSWYAYKLMTDVDKALKEAQIIQNTEDIAELKESNKGYAWAGTTAEWNALSDGKKEKLDGKEILITDDEGSSGLDDRVAALEDGEQITYSDTFSFTSATNGSATATESGIYTVCLSKDTTNSCELKDTTANKIVARTDAYASSARYYTLTAPIIKGHSYTLSGTAVTIDYQTFVRFCK